MKRETLRKIVAAVVLGLTRTTFEGTEYLPKQGGVLVATNHVSRLDTLLLFLNPARDDITALVADKYQKNPFFKWVMNTGGIIWLDRENADFGAVRAAVAALKRGVSMGIAPEGTRSPVAQLQTGKQGIVLVALKSGVPIVPVAIMGTQDVFVKMFTLRFPKITVRFGPAFTLPPLERENRDVQMQRNIDEIMCRVAALLPPANRGVYTDHPRLKELLSSQ
jgi:1-acyl-sn-glycerol-3-phosphate acyltransferase